VAARPASDVEDRACGWERELFDEEVHLWKRVFGEDVILVDRRMRIEELFLRALLFQRITHLFAELRALPEPRCGGRARIRRFFWWLDTISHILM